MKIIAVTPGRNGVKVVVAIIPMEDLLAITGREQYQKMYVEPGDTINVADRHTHALEIEKKIGEAVKLPETLRTLADMLEMNHPALTKLTTDETSPAK